MRKSVFAFIMLFVAFSVNAQIDFTVKFLGIPVDGNKSEMISRLEQKGFVYDIETTGLKGEFNGMSVNVYIHTNKDKVDRIMVCDDNTVDETAIKIRFNTLVSQFNNSKKYFSEEDNQFIPDDVDISYDMLVNNKRFQAIFHQTHTKEEGLELRQSIYDKYDTIVSALSDNKELRESGFNIDDLKTKNKDEAVDGLFYIFESLYTFNNDVWFMISKYGSEYYITMFYDNLLNRPNGEDL